MNSQKEKGANRPPRVHITTDVETYDAIPIKELPFIVGVMSNLSGHRVPEKSLAQREFHEFDSASLDRLMSDETLDILPHLKCRVANALKADGSEIDVEMDFRAMRDFEPGAVAQNFEPTRKLLEQRRLLERLLAKVGGRDKELTLLDDAIRASVSDKKDDKGSRDKGE